MAQTHQFSTRLTLLLLSLGLLVTTCPAGAQTFHREFGAGVGVANVTSEQSQDGLAFWGGASFAESVARGAVSLDYEYVHMREQQRLQLIGVGWRIAWEPDSWVTKPFIQVGGQLGIYSTNADTDARDYLVGLALTGGVTADLSSRSLIKLELRWGLLQGDRGPISLIQPGVLVGWRF